MARQLHRRFSAEEVKMLLLLGEVGLRIVPDETTGLADVRIWYNDTLTDAYQVRNADLNLVRF